MYLYFWYRPIFLSMALWAASLAEAGAVCVGGVGLLLFIRLSWGSFFFSCPSTSGPSGVQTLHPRNGAVKLLQLSNRIHRLRCSSETTSVRSIDLKFVQVWLFSNCFHVCGRSTTSPSSFFILPFLCPCFWTFVQVYLTLAFSIFVLSSTVLHMSERLKWDFTDETSHIKNLTTASLILVVIARVSCCPTGIFNCNYIVKSWISGDSWRFFSSSISFTRSEPL